MHWHVLGIHFSISNSNNMHMKCMKSAKKSIKLDLGLCIVTLVLIPGNGLKHNLHKGLCHPSSHS